MKPLYVLLAAFAIAYGATSIAGIAQPLLWAGNAAMAVMLCFTALGHFLFPKGMAMMLPDLVPFRILLIYVTGLIELAFAAALLIPSIRHDAAAALIAFFVCLTPANIYAAMRHLNYERGTFDGPGPGYLWIRMPLQALFIAWVWYFGVSAAPAAATLS